MSRSIHSGENARRRRPAASRNAQNGKRSVSARRGTGADKPDRHTQPDGTRRPRPACDDADSARRAHDTRAAPPARGNGHQPAIRASVPGRSCCRGGPGADRSPAGVQREERPPGGLRIRVTRVHAWPGSRHAPFGRGACSSGRGHRRGPVIGVRRVRKERRDPRAFRRQPSLPLPSIRSVAPSAAPDGVAMAEKLSTA